MRRLVRLSLLGVAGTLGLILLWLLPDLVAAHLPKWLRKYWAEELALGCVLAYATARALAAAPLSTPWRDRAQAGVTRVELVAMAALKRGLPLVMGLVFFAMLLSWVPHYLTWPWHRDHETLAVLAQSWDHGILPYRDIRAYNFPGTIYLAWVLGKVFGWGHTVPLHAFDTACLIVLGFVLLDWSQRRLDGPLSGLFAYLAFLVYYLELPYEIVAQRDWHTAFLVCVGLLLLQARPGRATRLASALLTALALAIRPHAALFLPALFCAVAQSTDAPEAGRSRRAQAVAVWCLWCGAFVAIAFAPLLLAGIADDLLRGLRVAVHGGPYSKATRSDMIWALFAELRSWRTDIPLVATLLAAAWPHSKIRGLATTWSAAWVAALLYQPIHPVHHLYLLLPLLVVSSITWALVAFWLLSFERLARPVLAVAVVLLAYEIMPEVPRGCGPAASVRALWPLFAGEMPVDPPPGCPRQYPIIQGSSARWTSYREVVAYLRRETGPQTLVANLINQFPYEAINGPTGRLSPFLAESGICWMRFVDIDLDAEFAQSLLEATDSVVVWEPRQTEVDPRLAVKRVIAVVRQHYEPAARLGVFEVWRRRNVKQQPRADARVRT